MFGWTRRRRAERELEEELEFHLEQAARRYGSRRQAEALLGGTETIKEECREQRAGAWLGSVGRDLRLGARILRRSPGFTLAAVLTLGLCLGCVTAAFGLLDQALLQPPPFPRPGRILAITSVLRGSPAFGNPLWAGDYADFRAGAPAFAALAAYNQRSFNLAGADSAAHVAGMAVTADFFKVLGASAAQGRTFLASEEQAGHNHVAVLSDALWHSHFAAAPMLGKTITLDGVAYQVIGIMPQDFDRGSYNYAEFDAALWVPLTISAEQLQHRRQAALTLFALGRLRPGASLAQAKSQIEAIGRSEAAAHPDEKGTGATVLSLQTYANSRDNNPAGLVLFMTLAGLILLIGCANVAGLGLGRAAARGGEMAIRRALGAGRARLVRQALTESALLVALAGGAGLLLGWLGMMGLNAGFGQLGAHLDGHGFAVLALALAVTVLGAGLPPALRAGARPLPRGASAVRSRGRDALVAVEIALTVASLVVIAFVAQDIQQEWKLPLGFQPAQVLAAEVSLRGPAYAAAPAQAAFIQRMLAAAAVLPGAQAAALVSPPTLSWNETTVAVRGRPPIDWHGQPWPKYFGMTSGYLDALRIPLLAGRAFTAADAAGAEPVALVSRSVARRLFAGANPLNHFLRLDAKDEPWRRIVGETGDLASYAGDNSTNGEIFEPLAQAPHPALGLVIRAAPGIAPATLTPALRHALAQMDPTLALYGAQPLAAELDANGAANDRFFLHALELLGGLALLLSAVGLYSVIAFAAAQRRRELGIRLALGATAPQLERLLLGRGLGLTALGLAAGLGLGWGGVRLLLAVAASAAGHAAVLPLYAVPALLLLGVAALATWLPARRAARADPLAALRSE